MIVPAILESTTTAVQEKINKVIGLVQRIQVDVVDGIFADNLTVSPVDLVDIDFGNLAIDIHLLTEEPVDLVTECGQLCVLGTSVRVIGQIERMGNQLDFLKQVKQIGAQAGLALDVFTPPVVLKPAVYAEIDCLLLMTGRGGFQGGRFQPKSLSRVSWLVDLRQRDQLDFPVILDGGLNPELINQGVELGASEFVVGSWLWQQSNVAEALVELEAATRVR